MKRVIFTTYDNIDIPKDRWQVADHAQHMISEYFDRLIQNKKDYAEKIGVDWIFYHNQMDDMDIGDNEFTKANLYKHVLFAQLAEKYDEVMYVDMDVIFNTNENVFEELDLSKGIHIIDQDEDIKNKELESILFEMVGQRSPTIKYHITKDMLDGQDNHVMNTGIMIAKSEHIKEIKYSERMIEAADLIKNIKDGNVYRDDAHFLRAYYYPNNESIFSYIMEKYKVPYVIMDKEWNWILSRDPVIPDWNKIKIAHFVNKKFNAYFNDKTKCVYSIYIEIPDDKLDNPRGHEDDPVNKSKRTKERLAQYKEQLHQNHAEYAKAIGADYIEFGHDDQYIEFAKRFTDLSVYDIINLYKVWLLDKLTHDYDLVLYIDYDVYFHSHVDAFNYLKAEVALCCNKTTKEEAEVFPNKPNYFKNYHYDFRSPQSKYWNAHALLQDEDLEPGNDIFNTGIMMASRPIMAQLDYFSDIEEVIAKMKELKEFSIYPPQIQAAFGYDNETIMSYKVEKNQVPVESLCEMWHNKHDVNDPRSFKKGTAQWDVSSTRLWDIVKRENTVMTHFISKNFGLVFDK
jgi:hypothetical protein